MKARIVAAVDPVEDAGHNVLTAVLLHAVKTWLPVNGALHFCAGNQGAVTDMHHCFPLLLGIQNPDTAQNARISCLTAALRIEGSGIQDYIIFIFLLLTGFLPGRKLL